MKVTVCFGPVKVIVPCGEGDLSVQELIERAVSRYRKASYKNSVENVTVRWLETSEDNAILDPDDKVNDVCDDRDKLIAVFDEKVKKRPSNNGDGTSASSVGTASPDLFQSQVKYDDDDHFRSIDQYGEHEQESSHPNVVSTTEEQKYTFHDSFRRANGPQDGFFRNDYLQSSVRSLELKKELDREQQLAHGRNRPSQLVRDGWGVGGVNSSQQNGRVKEAVGSNQESSSVSPASSPDEPPKDFAGFHRTVNRKSLSAGHPMLYSWIDAQEKMFEDKYLQRSSMNREEPAGSSLSSPRMDDHRTQAVPAISRSESVLTSGSESEEVELNHQDVQKLGLQVRGYKTADGREIGLIIVDVAKPEKQERLQVADRITKVNGVDLRGCSNVQAEELFIDALKAESVKLKRTRSHTFVTDKARRRSSSGQSMNKIPESVVAISKEAPKPVNKVIGPNEHKEKAIEAPGMPKDKVDSTIENANKISIELTKGKDGLGFSITSRDVMTTGASRIFVKNILNKGAAIEDGKLEIGDELVEVNGKSVVGMQQSDVAQMLRTAQGTVSLVVQRISTESDSTKPVEELAVTQDLPETDTKSEVLSLSIPLTTLGSAGLGISVKGKTNGGEEKDEDLGIFVKSVLKGGAAAKDGRLQQEDQLLCIDDSSLIGLPNSEAMETLRIVMQNAIKKGSIKIIISRNSSKSHSRPSSRRNSLQPEKTEPESKPEIKPEITPEIRPEIKPEPRHTHQSSGSSLELATEKQFDNTYLKRLAAPRNKSPVRNQSYFKAVDRTITSVDGVHQVPQVIQVIRKPPSDEKEKVPRSVSVNSVQLPAPQPTKPIYIDRNGVQSEGVATRADTTAAKDHQSSLSGSKQQLNGNPPPYKEAMQRQSSHSGSDTSERLKTSKSVSVSTAPVPEESGQLMRATSVSSQVSIDSLMIGPSDMPFSRDAFGRLSMSERKGRAHLDATKSDFYTKLKKFRSMEDISKVKGDDNYSPTSRFSRTDGKLGLSPFGDGMRRSESVDTILSKTHDESEEPTFSRNAIFNTKSPMVGPRATSPPSSKTSVKLRSRSTAWNDSFRTAVDKTPVFYSQSASSKPAEGKADVVPITWTSNARYGDEKQRKKSNGFLKGLGNIFKISKPKKQPPPSPEIMTLGRKSKLKSKEREEALIDFPEKTHRPNSLHEDVLRDIRSETIAQQEEFAAKLHQREQKLVELKKQLSQNDKQPLSAAISSDGRQGRKTSKTSEGKHNTKDILNSLATNAAKSQVKQSNNINDSTSNKSIVGLGRTDNAQFRSSRGGQKSNNFVAKTNDPVRSSRHGPVAGARPGTENDRSKIGESRSQPVGMQQPPRIHNMPKSKAPDSKVLQKTRLDYRQVSLPKQLIFKRSDQNANTRSASQTEADHLRKISLEKQSSLIDNQDWRRNIQQKEKIDLAQISDKKDITISHTAQI